MSLQNKKVLLIIGGGISAYKSLDLIRLLLRKKSSVKVVLTKSGKKFVTLLSVSSLLKGKVFEEMFEIKATTDARVRDDWSEDLRAVDKPSLPPALPQHVRRVCRGVGGEAGQG